MSKLEIIKIKIQVDIKKIIKVESYVLGIFSCGPVESHPIFNSVGSKAERDEKAKSEYFKFLIKTVHFGQKIA